MYVWEVSVTGCAQTHPSLFQVRQQLSEMKSHVEDGDVAGSPAVPPGVSPAEQDPMKVRVVSCSSDVSLTAPNTVQGGKPSCWLMCWLLPALTSTFPIPPCLD